MATLKQIEYIAQLFIDIGAHTSLQRKAFIYNRFMRKNSDELTIIQASKLIEELKEIKEGNHERKPEREMDS